MEATSAHTPRAAIVWCSRMLTVLSAVLLLGTIVALPLTALTISGRGDLTLRATVDPPYSLGLDLDPMAGSFPTPVAMGRMVYVDGGRITTYFNFPMGHEREELRHAPSVHTDLRIKRDDRDTRALLAGLVASWLALAWLGLESLRRVVHSARGGQPFDARNVRRLRWAAAAAIAFPVVSRILIGVADSTLDSTLHVTPTGMTGATPWALAGIGVGLLALAEVFCVGTELTDLEQSTV